MATWSDLGRHTGPQQRSGVVGGVYTGGSSIGTGGSYVPQLINVPSDFMQQISKISTTTNRLTS